MGPLEAEGHRKYQIRFLIPKRYDELSRSLKGCPPPLREDTAGSKWTGYVIHTLLSLHHVDWIYDKKRSYVAYFSIRKCLKFSLRYLLDRLWNLI